MKKLIFLFLIIVGFSAKSQTPKDRQQILSLMGKQSTDWNKGDLESFMQTYWKSDSLMFIGKSGVTYGWQQTLDNYKKGYPDKAAMGFLTFDIKKIDFLGENVAWVLGSWHLKREKDEPKGYYTLLLKKIDGQWKIVADHSS
jgi:ketosteroid isomerase-like protein